MPTQTNKKEKWEEELNKILQDYLPKDYFAGKLYFKKIIEKFILNILKEQREEIEKQLTKEFTTHQRCLNCGKKKDRYSLSDWCSWCLETA